jgi:cytochrome c oxidase subunit 2
MASAILGNKPATRGQRRAHRRARQQLETQTLLPSSRTVTRAAAESFTMPGMQRLPPPSRGRSGVRALPFLLLPAVLGAPALAQEPLHSALQAQGEAAGRILQITWVLMIGGGLIFVAVMLLLGLALAGPPSWRKRLGQRAWIVGGGIAFPVVVLSALLLYTFAAAAGMGRAQQVPAAARIEVAGELWWWRVRYLDAAGATLLETAIDIHVPVGQPVDLQLVSHDVIHSFWVPNLAGKVDLIPGRTNRLRLHAREPGIYRGQCAEYCGAQHARMALQVVAQPVPQFQAWLAVQQQAVGAGSAVDAADTQTLARGQALFGESRCGVCHTVRGTPANGTLGPDLTHVGSRRTLAAGTLPNGPQTLAAWITHSQDFKPGVRMPAYRQLAGADLQALTAYLASLR